MNKTIDACGRSCPEPVLMTKRELDSGALPLNVLVDNEAAASNVTRYAENAGCKVKRLDSGGIHTLEITK